MITKHALAVCCLVACRGSFVAAPGSADARGAAAAADDQASGDNSADVDTSARATSTGATAATGTPDKVPLPVVVLSVGACDNLAAVGTWELITPPDMTPTVAPKDSMGNDIGPFYRPAVMGLDPQDPGTVYVGTDSFDDGHSKGLYKTTDCGSTWMHVSTGRNSDAINGGRNWTLAIDPTDSRILYTNSGYYKNGLYKSINGGVDWDEVTPNNGIGFVSHVRMDPNDPKHLLLDYHTNCGNWADNNGCFSESVDGGQNWNDFYAPTGQHWNGQLNVWMMHDQRWVINWSASTSTHEGVSRTTNGAATWQDASASAAGGHSAGSMFHAKNGVWWLGTESGMLRADADDGAFALVPNSGSWSLFMTSSDTDLYLSTIGGFKTSKIEDGVTWTDMPGSPHTAAGGACFPGYDPAHHLLYASCLENGLWRMRTQ